MAEVLYVRSVAMIYAMHPFNLQMSDLVVVCTPTYNRRFSLDFSAECYKRQTYTNLHWIILDNSSDEDKNWSPITEKGIPVTYISIAEKKPIGHLRNVCLEAALKMNPKYIAFWDDDDYYPPQRIAASVAALEKDTTVDIIGCAILPVFLSKENVLMETGPYGTNHSTAATYLFRASIATNRRFIDNAEKAEEGSFTRDWTLPMCMLPAKDILLVIGHQHNTVNKSQMLANPTKFAARILNADNAKNIVRFQWIRDRVLWDLFYKTFLLA
jgi:glycosyltransferase involved in cell wall biosynthesis